MTATLTVHQCPSCHREVVVYAKTAQVWHRCPKKGTRDPLTAFRVVEVAP